jgi:hypothetical protein
MFKPFVLFINAWFVAIAISSPRYHRQQQHIRRLFPMKFCRFVIAITILSLMLCISYLVTRKG